MTRRRLDAELVRRGLSPSPEEARQAVTAGMIEVGGIVTNTPATLVDPDAAIRLAGEARPFASRAGGKLAAALDRFDIDPEGAQCLDAGSSTGGFTDVLLQRGARHVVAVDVGYGQLAWALRTDDRVTVLERTNIRDVTDTDLPYSPGLVVADLSFISLRTVLPGLVGVADTTATFVLLVKPQFEAGRGAVGAGGVVRDDAVWRRVLGDVVADARGLGLGIRGSMASPVRGPAGNVEFLLWLSTVIGPELDDAELDAAVAEGRELAR